MKLYNATASVFFHSPQLNAFRSACMGVYIEVTNAVSDETLNLYALLTKHDIEYLNFWGLSEDSHLAGETQVPMILIPALLEEAKAQYKTLESAGHSYTRIHELKRMYSNLQDEYWKAMK